MPGHHEGKNMLSTTARAAVAGTAVSLILAGGAGAAQAAVTPTPTSLTISVSSTGTSTVVQPIIGRLTAGTKVLPNQVVRLVAELAGTTTFKTLAYARTSAKGVAMFKVKPPKGKDLYKLVFNGNRLSTPNDAGSHSRTITVTVAK